nr:MAG TPA: hypothetical protein [Caudoviricetes sp.]
MNNWYFESLEIGSLFIYIAGKLLKNARDKTSH